MSKVRGTWARPGDDSEFHAMASIVGTVVFAYCRKQWAVETQIEVDNTKLLDRCDCCQGRLIEANRVGIGLRELERSVLWEAEMYE